MTYRVVVFFVICMLPLGILVTASEYNLDTKTCAAIANDRRITIESFRNTLARLRASKDMKSMLKTLNPQGKEDILNEMIDDKLFAVDAQKRKLDKDPKIQEAIQDAIDGVLAEALIQEEVSSLNLGEIGLKRFYQDNADIFRRPDRIRARHIITLTQPEAQAALDRVKNGEDFQIVASEVNIDATKSKGGDLGLVPRGIMVKPFEDALFSLEEGQVSGIVKTSFGFHIIKVEEIDKGQLKPFNTVKEEVKRRIIDQHILQLKENLKKKYPVKINRELLMK